MINKQMKLIMPSDRLMQRKADLELSSCLFNLRLLLLGSCLVMNRYLREIPFHSGPTCMPSKRTNLFVVWV